MDLLPISKDFMVEIALVAAGIERLPKPAGRSDYPYLKFWSSLLYTEIGGNVNSVETYICSPTSELHG